jgi:Coenzyme PQQ synthesis protein D (PqqD)
MEEIKELSLRNFIKVSDDVVSRDLEGEAVVLNLETGIYFGLNEVGTRIWSLIEEHGSLQKVFAIIKDEYDVPSETLENDLLRIVQELHAKGLIHVS